MQKLYTLDFRLARAQMCLIALDLSYDRESREMPYYRHRHNAFETHFLTAGSCVMRAGEENIPLQKGELFFIEPGMFHSLKTCTADYNRICLIFEIVPGQKAPTDKETIELLNAIESLRTGTLPAEGLADTLLRIRDTAADGNEKIGETAKLQALLELFLIDLAERLDKRKSESEERVSPLDKARVFLIDEFFHGNFRRGDGDRILADELRVSRRQLDRVLKKLYGKGFREKLLEVRLEVAKDLLHTTDRSVEEISELLGYGSPSNFCTFIKSQTGKTPSAIRKEQNLTNPKKDRAKRAMTKTSAENALPDSSPA